MRAVHRKRAFQITLGAAFFGILVDATCIEPYTLVTTHDTVRISVREPLTIAHLSDLHTHGYGALERQIVDQLWRLHPDLILVTGDVVDRGSLEPARELFTRLKAPLGIWVVRGNWEHWNPIPNESQFYQSIGANLLVNSGSTARQDLWIGGIDDSSSAFADVDAAVKGAPSASAKILLLHSPALFDRAAPKFDLAFAGHTHGGQVRAPWLGPLWLPPGSGRFIDGWYESGRARMFVSRGIGTSILPVRFLCKPQIEIVSVVPSHGDHG